MSPCGHSATCFDHFSHRTSPSGPRRRFSFPARGRISSCERRRRAGPSPVYRFTSSVVSEMPTAVLLSGGLDSAVLLVDEASRGEVQPVYVSVGLAWEAAERRAVEHFLAG